MKTGLVLLCLIVIPGIVFADADGPDYWEVRDVAADDVLNIRTEADWRSEKVGEIPADGRCIKNLGCVGGLTFDEFRTLSDAEQQKMLKKRPRWCEIEYHGVRGWVAGRYLREGEVPCDQ
ncbi:MAG: SH3 domain-containing protein [Candidatus Competibacteraceae bacterium]|nr:SH3 domain-containing protein [Candidatus Competibacteraceae bacterium]